MGGRLSRKGYPSWLPHDWDAFRLWPQGVPVDPAALHGLSLDLLPQFAEQTRERIAEIAGLFQVPARPHHRTGNVNCRSIS